MKKVKNLEDLLVVVKFLRDEWAVREGNYDFDADYYPREKANTYDVVISLITGNETSVDEMIDHCDLPKEIKDILFEKGDCEGY